MPKCLGWENVAEETPCDKLARDIDLEGQDLLCCCDKQHMRQLKMFMPADKLEAVVANYRKLTAAAADNPLLRPGIHKQRMAILKVCLHNMLWQLACSGSCTLVLAGC